MLVIIDSPGFTLWVARFVHWLDRTIPIVDYVSPSVWAWRPGRARSMRRYIDHVLALLPFEPDVHRRLGGPPCSYVGHPLIEEVAKLRPNDDRGAAPTARSAGGAGAAGQPQRRDAPARRRLRRDARAAADSASGRSRWSLPTVPHLLAQVTQATSTWPVRPRIVVEQAEKQAAFRIARAALAKSGTVTLELAVAGVPMVAAYKVSASRSRGRSSRLMRVPSYILANLVLGQNVVPELLQDDCTPNSLPPRSLR